MEYVLFIGFKRIGSFYHTIEEAKKEITETGIYNICQVETIDGKLKIINRITIKQN